MKIFRYSNKNIQNNIRKISYNYTVLCLTDSNFAKESFDCKSSRPNSESIFLQQLKASRLLERYLIDAYVIKWPDIAL